uniref:Zinc-finger domain-containing protein n=1 Tax=Heterosigma akashiwo TaxID=2829 RepID=A0A6V1M0Z9_HETAK|mmetsp:Transcript_57485/g.84089  ORF Transcript_57485/g.84089 Transcript_57485/m.84089 type:complete len:354 (+) Transcript_57485:66-1127(+)
MDIAEQLQQPSLASKVQITERVSSSCHCCHNVRDRVWGNCQKGYTSHFYCEPHLLKRFNLTPKQLIENPDRFAECPVCDKSCTCGPCQNGPQKRKGFEGTTELSEEAVALAAKGAQEMWDQAAGGITSMRGGRLPNAAPTTLHQDANCHICHSKVNISYSSCQRGFRSHSYCAKHLLSKFRIDPALWSQTDNTLLPPCPVCSLTCPCKACQRKLLDGGEEAALEKALKVPRLDPGLSAAGVPAAPASAPAASFQFPAPGAGGTLYYPCGSTALSVHGGEGGALPAAPALAPAPLPVATAPIPVYGAQAVPANLPAIAGTTGWGMILPSGPLTGAGKESNWSNGGGEEEESVWV